MKTKDVVELLAPVYKMNKQCAIHYAAMKNQTKKGIFAFTYTNIQNLMRYLHLAVHVDKKYYNNAWCEYKLLSVNLDISHETKCVSDGFFADLLSPLSEIGSKLQSYTDEDDIDSVAESSAATAEPIQ